LAGSQGALAAPPDEWILDAMKAEMDRARTGLKLEGYDPAYFSSMSVRTAERYYISAKYGALFQSTRSNNGMANVDVRVGSYDMDSSEDPEGYFTPGQKFIPNSLAPVEKSVQALRRVLWLLADYKYKAALVSFLKVKGKRVNDPKARTVGSLTREEPVKLSERPPPLKFDVKTWEPAMRRASAVFLDFPDIFDSSTEIAAIRQVRYFVNTEGSAGETADDYYQILVSAVTRAEDGMLIQDALTFYGRSSGDLPDPAKLEGRVREFAQRMVKMRTAALLSPATVPVLMSPEATGVFFHETIGHRLEGQRQEDEEEGRTFKNFLNQKILPEFITVSDDPTAPREGTVALNGHYRVDDEGVAGRKVVLVDRGILKTFLMGRKPLEGFSNSNGHGRSDGFARPVARMAVLRVDGANPVSHERLREMLLEEVRRQDKPYGLIIETIAGGSTNTSSYGYQAFKGIPRVAWRVDAKTGKEELVRGVELVGTPLSSLNKILATSDRYGVFNGYCGAESGSVPVSTIAPEMLFGEIELQRAQEGTERSPILPPP
jgi:predicted Zn-dependent protease